MQLTLTRPLDWRIGIYLAAVVILAVYWALAPIPGTSDAENYWLLDLSDPYRNRWAEAESFVYSPAFAQAFAPFTLLPFEVFYKVWQAINLVCLWWLVGPWAAPALALPFVQQELVFGQIHLPLAVSLVLMLRYPGTFALGALTKVTPGIAVLWWVARREWRQAAVATGVTGGIVIVSALVWPVAWVEWFDLLAESSRKVETNLSVAVWPALLRLPVAASLLVLAARRDRPTALPLCVLLALPGMWPGAFVLLLAVPRLSNRY